MFYVRDNVPDVYINESRDFQLFARLYDLVFQSNRFSIDSMSCISDTMNCNDTLLPLLATKVGFFTDLNLTSKADRQILSAFPHIIKYKGSMKAIELITNLFEHIMNTTVDIETEAQDKNYVRIVFKERTPNVDMLYTLLNYVRPTGMIVDYVVRNELSNIYADYTTEDFVTISNIADESLSYIPQINSEYSEATNVGFTQIQLEESDEK